MDIGKNLYDLRKKNAISNGADMYITKPFLPEHIRMALKELTGGQF